MEHLHPDDAIEQLVNIVAALQPGGRYICITPNRLTGPHDISAWFDEEPRGFHLHEYTYRELGAAFRQAGFRRVGVLQRGQGRALAQLERLVSAVSPAAARAVGRWGEHAVTMPLAPYLLIERLATSLPGDVSNLRLVRRLLGINLIAERR